MPAIVAELIVVTIVGAILMTFKEIIFNRIRMCIKWCIGVRLFTSLLVDLYFLIFVIELQHTSATIFRSITK